MSCDPMLGVTFADDTLPDDIDVLKAARLAERIARHESEARASVSRKKLTAGHAATGVIWTSYPRLSSFTIRRLVAAPLSRRSK